MTTAVGADAETLPGERVRSYDVDARLGTDYYAVFADVAAEDRAVWERAQAFVDEVGPACARRGTAPSTRWTSHGGWVSSTWSPTASTTRGLTRSRPLAAGLVNMEVSRGRRIARNDASRCRAGSPCAPSRCSEAPRRRRAGCSRSRAPRCLGAFALTEPDHGSDSVSLETTAAACGRATEWVLEGAKKWIGNGASGGVTFVWARVEDPAADDHGAVRCFLVEQDRPGYTGTPILGKASLRGIHQAHITLDDVHVPLESVLPGARSFKDASTVLYATRSGVAWSALGHATACYEAALSYSRQRTQFGKPLARFQMVQERLARMLEELTAMQLYCRRLADLEASGDLRPTQASLAKFHNTRAARRIAASARDLLGGNGILIENVVMQHMADIEAIHTYEGTESIQALLIGRDITGVSAFA